ncbi:Major tail tube protein (Protein FII) [Pantoea vagans C9-1]|uniref:phage major tail tube protein n=1 Tax=Pantoea vagans TaxID=470934 RepID=UPI0001E592E8|nr:phage major tail tube protein [Pantoea vagans]ADO09830.1 Major tail tube protein (Protein FII) [Pantoea vagans C9-1]
MALPRKLKGMNLFNNANSYQGVVTAVTLPKLARKLDPFRAGGMSGAAFIDNGLEDDALDIEWSIGGIDELVLTQWGASDIPLRFTGSYQRDDTGEEIAVEIEVRGKHQSFDFGEAKQGEDTETKITSKNTYYKLTFNGKELIEIDTINMVEKVNASNERGLSVRVGAVLKGETEITWGESLYMEYVTTRNSPLWKTAPKQQLAYLAVKYWARLYCPDVILGVYTPDEFEPAQRAERDVTPARSRADLNNLINSKPEAQQPEREINPATNNSAAARTPDELLADFTEASANADSVSSLDRFYKYAARMLASETETLEKATDVYLIRKAEIEEALSK